MAIAQQAPQQSGFFKSEPSRTTRLVYTALWLGLYLIAFYALRDFLPDKFLRDAKGLAEMIRSQKVDDNSFGAMAKLYDKVPGWFLPHLPAIVGVLSIVTVLSYVRSYGLMLLMPFVMYPFIMFNFLMPSKETLVGIMALVIHRICRNPRHLFFAFCAIAVIYGVYGALVREYYLLILVLFMGFFMIQQTPIALWLPITLFVFVALFFVPGKVFLEIQGSRDLYAEFQSQAGGGVAVRTYFYNIVRDPQNVFAFMLNTAWGLLVLVCPFIVAQTVNEMAMMVNVLIYGMAALAGYRHAKGAARLPFMLFLAHIITQAQFEPDLGSYLRHFCSVLVLVAPGLQYMWRVKPAGGQVAAPATMPAGQPLAAR